MRTILALWLLLALPAYAAPALDETGATQTLTYTLGPLRIEGLMEAMTGPVLKEEMRTIAANVEGPVWIKSFKVTTLDGMSQPDDSLEFLCHAWLTAKSSSPLDEHLLTISQGMDEMKFPPGYGVRLDSIDDAAVMAQALNDNNVSPRDVRYRITIRYIPEKEAVALGLKHLRTVTAGIDARDAVQTFIANTTIGGDNKKICADRGASFLVPPGRHEYRTVLNTGHRLQHGGTIHAIKLHLHAYGTGMSLVDETTGQAIWQGKARNAQGKALITHVDDYNSAKGLQLTAGHRYAVTAVYDNQTKESVEAMAVLRIYVSD